MASNSESAFRFMDLPTEIRLYVYKFLPTREQHHDIYSTFPGRVLPNEKPTCTTLVIHGLPLAILRVCKEVCAEASPIMTKKILQLRKTRPSVIIDIGTTFALIGGDGVCNRLAEWLEFKTGGATATFDAWVAMQSQPLAPPVSRYIQQVSVQMQRNFRKQVNKHPACRHSEFFVLILMEIHIRGSTLSTKEH